MVLPLFRHASESKPVLATWIARANNRARGMPPPQVQKELDGSRIEALSWGMKLLASAFGLHRLLIPKIDEIPVRVAKLGAVAPEELLRLVLECHAA